MMNGIAGCGEGKLRGGYAAG